MLNQESEIIFNNNSNGLTPTIPQEEALFSISKMKQQNKNKYLIVLPSGIGKTYLSAFETYDFDGRILYVAHRNEILIQAKKVFKNIHKIEDKDIGIYKQKKKQLNKKIIFASIQSIGRRKNLEKIPKDYFDYIILDEWHHVGALSYKRILNHFKPKYLLGMTATPYRLDGKDILSSVNYNVPYQMELKEGIESGWLVPVEYYGLWDDIDYSDIKWKGYKYTQKDLDKKLLINKRDHAVITEVKKRIGKRQTIGFCSSVKHVKRCVKKFNDAGFSTNAIYYEIDLDERRKIIDDFRDGKYQVLFTRDIFNEGVDFPEVECLLFLRPTFSKTVFFQQLGRGLRKRKGKENVLVLDFIGNYTNAYKIKEWIREVVVETGEGKSYYKPEFVHNISKVHFDDRVVDLFEMQKPMSDEMIIDEFYKLVEKIGRIPRYEEFEWACRASWRWGTWTKFLTYLGEKTRGLYVKTIKDVEIEYFRLKKLLKQEKPLTKKQFNDLRKRGVANFGVYNMGRGYGISYNEFLFRMGEKPSRWDFLDKTMLEEYYIKLKKKLGRQPLFSEVPFSLCILKKIGYSSWSSFVGSMGDKPYLLEISKDEIIKDIRRVWKKLGKQPSSKQYDIEGVVHSATVSNKFNMTWKEVMIDIMGGDNIKGRAGGENKILQDELEKEYVRIRNILGRPVVESDILSDLSKYSKGGYLRVWGKLSNAQRYLEKKYFDNYFHPTKQDCIDVYIEERKKSKKPVPISRIKKISHSIYEKKFGGLINAKMICEKEYIKSQKG